MTNNNRNIRNHGNIQEFLDANYAQYAKDAICTSINMDIEYAKACALISIAKSLENIQKNMKQVSQKQTANQAKRE